MSIRVRRGLEIKLEHAEDLYNVNYPFFKMDVYAVVSFSDEINKAMSDVIKSPPDAGGHTAPVWNFTMRYKADEEALQTEYLDLHFHLRSGNKDVGDAKVSAKHLFDNATKADSDGWRCMSLTVNKPGDGMPQGRLHFSYRFSLPTNPAAFHEAQPPPPKRKWAKFLSGLLFVGDVVLPLLAVISVVLPIVAVPVWVCVGLRLLYVGLSALISVARHL